MVYFDGPSSHAEYNVSVKQTDQKRDHHIMPNQPELLTPVEAAEVLREPADDFPHEVRNRITLCRCGASSNKPFCDASHISIKYIDDN